MLDTLNRAPTLTCQPKLPLLEQLKRRRAETQKTLQNIDEAIKALEDNPEFEKMLNVLGKVANNF